MKDPEGTEEHWDVRAKPKQTQKDEVRSKTCPGYPAGPWWAPDDSESDCEHDAPSNPSRYFSGPWSCCDRGRHLAARRYRSARDWIRDDNVATNRRQKDTRRSRRLR